MKRIYKSQIIFISALLISYFLGGCSQMELKSTWRQNEIKIDGSKEDWQGKLRYFEDEKVAAAIANDSENVYFCFATSDNNKIMKILRMGFTIWLDPQESDGKTIGIQFPIKRDMNNNMSGYTKDRLSGNNEPVKNMIDRFKLEQNEVLIVNEDNFPLNAYSLKNEMGLEVTLEYEMHQLIYELKLPIANNSANDNLYLDVLPNELLKVGFETGEFDRDDMQNKGNSIGMNSSGGRGGGRKGGMGGSGRSGGNRSDIMRPMNFWIDVKLANSNNVN